jgi:hypothetical protein
MNETDRQATWQQRHDERQGQFLAALPGIRAELPLAADADKKVRIRATLDRIAAAIAADLAESALGAVCEPGAMAGYAREYVMSGDSLGSLRLLVSQSLGAQSLGFSSPPTGKPAPMPPQEKASEALPDRERARRRKRISAILDEIREHLDDCILTNPLLASRLESRKTLFLRALAEIRGEVSGAPVEETEDVKIGRMYDEVAAYAAAHVVETEFGPFAPNDALTPHLRKHFFGGIESLDRMARDTTETDQDGGGAAR